MKPFTEQELHILSAALLGYEREKRQAKGFFATDIHASKFREEIDAELEVISDLQKRLARALNVPLY